MSRSCSESRSTRLLLIGTRAGRSHRNIFLRQQTMPQLLEVEFGGETVSKHADSDTAGSLKMYNRSKTVELCQKRSTLSILARVTFSQAIQDMNPIISNKHGQTPTRTITKTAAAAQT